MKIDATKRDLMLPCPADTVELEQRVCIIDKHVLKADAPCRLVYDVRDRTYKSMCGQLEYTYDEIMDKINHDIIYRQALKKYSERT